MHRRCIDLRGSIGEAAVARLALLGRSHQPPDVGKKGGAVGGGHLDGERTAEIERAGVNLRSGSHGNRDGLAGDQALVDVARPSQNQSVSRHPLAGPNEHLVAGHERMRRNRPQAAALPDQRGDATLQAEQVLRLAAGADAKMLVEVAADQQEEQERDRRIEIDLVAAHHRLVEAHARGENDGERDRHIHVEPPPLQGGERRGIEGLTGIDYGWQRNQRRQPAEQRHQTWVHIAGAPGPHRHGQQHDVHGGEACDRDAAKERRFT